MHFLEKNLDKFLLLFIFLLLLTVWLILLVAFGISDESLKNFVWLAGGSFLGVVGGEIKKNFKTDVDAQNVNVNTGGENKT